MATTAHVRKIAEVFAPGEFIQEELEARGWTEADLARAMGRSIQDVNDLLSGNLRVSPQIATELATAFGTSTDLWIGLERSYRSGRVEASTDASESH